MSKEIKSVEYGLEKNIWRELQDFLPLLRTDYVEFYVEYQAGSAFYKTKAFGFQWKNFAMLD
jgi:4-hydroxyphenylpyruvate dioxygenase